MSHTCDGRDLTCASCLALAQRLETVRAAMTVDDELDDVKRARIWMQLDERLADVGPARRPRAAIAIGVAAATAVAAAGLFLALAPRNDDRHTLAVPVDTVVTSQLGPHTFASIVGPTQLDILGASGDATAIRLRSGTLLVEFVGGSGRSLRVEAPGATIDVVGTLFAVAVRDGATCTSVAHGDVRVTVRSSVVHVAAGQRYCNGEAIRPIADDVRDALVHHGSRVVRSPSPGAGASEPATASTASTASPASIAPTAAIAARTGPAGSVQSAAPTATAIGTREPAPTVDGPVRTREPAPTVDGPVRTREPAPTVDGPVRTREPAPTVDGPVRTREPAPALDLAVRTREPAPAVDGPVRTREPAPAVTESKPPASPDELYGQAEAALAARDVAAADRALARLVDEHPISLLVDQALYERARIAYQLRSWEAARSHLARLAAIVGTGLAEPGRYLRCRIAVESKEPSAAACLTDYRAAFPSSAHDLDALALLAQLAHASAGCAGAEKLVAELAERYPRATLATAWRTRCPEPR